MLLLIFQDIEIVINPNIFLFLRRFLKKKTFNTADSSSDNFHKSFFVKQGHRNGQGLGTPQENVRLRHDVKPEKDVTATL